jgi:hypothetical protein
MKYLHIVVPILLLGCEAKTVVDPPPPPEEITLEVKQFTTGSANTRWVYFNFAKGDTVPVSAPTASQEWDVAFRRTTVKINGGTSGPGKAGVAMLTGINFEDIKDVPASTVFAVDDSTSAGYALPAGSGNGWYHYTAEPNHWIVAIADRVFIFRSADEKYVKVKFISYYSDGLPPSQPLQSDSGYYTFKYVYQPNGSRKFE